MYPPANKTALPSKEMQIFRSLVGPDMDSDHLFTMALKFAKQRVVVKRPHEAPPFKVPVTHSYESKLVRFDMYKV
jgi:16S rRNA (guanine1516-N2)-methyltransferase